MFGLLFSVILHGASAIDKHRRDKYYMSSPMYYDKKGRAVYMDSSRNKYINGEKVVSKYDYQNHKLIEVGTRSETVYFDPIVEKAERMREQYDKPNLRRAEQQGKLACKLYHPEFDKMLTTEISTGKIIVCIYHDVYTNECRKFYYRGGYECFISNGCFSNSAPGDMGIIITKDEYDKLWDIGQTYSTTPRLETFDELQRISKGKRMKEEKKFTPHKPIPCDWKTNVKHNEDDNEVRTNFIY